jgi:hypothetical protein
MSGRGDLLKGVHNVTFGIDQKAHAVNADVLFAVHGLLFENSIGFAHLFINIGEQVEREAVFVFELLLFGDRVGGDAIDYGTDGLDTFECVAEPARFNGSTGGVRLRVEEQHRPLAFQRRQSDSFI